MKVSLVFLLVLAFPGAAFAQGQQCRTSPVGASTPYCSSEAFVTDSIAAIPPVTPGVTSVATGDGLLGGPITSTGTATTDPSFFRDYLAGLTLSTAGASSTFGIASGIAVDATNAGFMKLASAYTKTTGAWVVGSGNGALDTGTITISTWYHVFLMRRLDTGVVDLCISVTVTGCTTGSNIPAAYTLFRRIGSMKTDVSSHWTKFSQLGAEFLWDTPTQDNAGINNGTVAISVTANVPPGVEVWALPAIWFNPSATVFVLISSLDSADIAPSINNFTGLSLVNAGFNFVSPIRTNTAGQYRFRASVSETGVLYTHSRGWNDPRGQNN